MRPPPSQPGTLFNLLRIKPLHILYMYMEIFSFNLITIFLRMVYLDHMSNRLSTSLVKKEEDAMEEDEEDMFLASKVHLRLKMADSSCHKRNHKLALNILADIHKVIIRAFRAHVTVNQVYNECDDWKFMILAEVCYQRKVLNGPFSNKFCICSLVYSI